MTRVGAGSGSRRGALASALVLALVACPFAIAARPAKRPARIAPVEAFGAFTPAAADPRLAAAFARSGLGAANFSGGAFRFTPSGSGRRAVTVAVRARGARRQDAAHGGIGTGTGELAASAYSLGVSIGWRHFALSGDVARTDAGLLPDSHESADVGFSVTGRRWATKVDLAADRAIGERMPLFGIDQSWSVGLGGSYALTHNLDVTGGVRYKAQQFQSLQEDRRDSQAVYLGTTFRF